ncbi:MAG TPA: dockerin type I repeat-containing protein, partial [bacterium]|nr:dockerin type I repeat-containing protein [bacterium]
PTPTPTPECLHHGDVNFSGTLTAADAQYTFNIVLGTIIPTYLEECAADCNANGSITAGDAQTIFQAVLGMGSCVDPLL